jgi:ABC-2 type transport system permease protein
MKFLRDVSILTGRLLRVTSRLPWVVIPNVGISLFFLVVYTGGLSGIAALPAFDGLRYIAFIVPVAVVSGAVGGAGGAGQAIVRDFETGYWAKLALTPVSRYALVVAPMLSGLVQLMGQTVLIVGVAIGMGLRIPTGWGGFLGLVALAAGWGLAFAGYAVAIGLRTRNGQAAQAATFVFFPLLFLSDTFVPVSLIQAHWMRTLIRLNPTTYVFAAMRALLRDPVAWPAVWHGVLAVVVAAGVTLVWAVTSVRASLAARS